MDQLAEQGEILIILNRQRRDLIEVSRNCPERVYLELRIPSDIQSVDQIIFTLSSHDQGFSHNAHIHGGTYIASYTWFFVSAVTAGRQKRVPKRVLQYNVHAKAEFTQHEITWRADDLVDSGIAEWVRSLRGGDAVQVIPMAQWLGWVNYVGGASIEMHARRAVPLVPHPMASIMSRSTPAGTRYYRPLQEGEIRLIVLDEASGTGIEPVVCELVYAQLAGPVPYEALSYCWGDPRERGVLDVRVAGNTWELSATTTLLAALRRLRRKGIKRTLWVDAVCINQDDLEERANQVRLMREIYTTASSVVVWVGEGDEKTSQTFATIKAIQARYEAGGTSAGDIDHCSKDDIHYLIQERHEDTPSFIEAWSLFERPWFRRTWVVQEVFNARSATVYCGRDVLPWKEVLRVQRCMDLRGMMANSAHKVFMPPLLEVIFKAKADGLSGMPILNVLIKGLDLDATDPRDKIFAMLQFGVETCQPSIPNDDLAIDYSRSVAEVFARFTKWWIQEHNSLAILSAIQALEGRTWMQTSLDQDPTASPAPGLASWAWGYQGRSNWAVGLLGFVDPPYSASGCTIPDANITSSSPSWHQLPLSGTNISTIASISHYPYFDTIGKHGSEALHRAYVRLFDPLNIAGKWGDQLGSHKLEYLTNTDPDDVRNHYNTHREFATDTAALSCHSPCLMATQDGKKGLCPFAAAVGDIIVVLDGGNVPYTLRPNFNEVDTWEFVGECYLEGYMHGLAQEEYKRGLRQNQVFILV
ncbi:HET domain containing protein [Rhypophila decipiens]